MITKAQLGLRVRVSETYHQVKLRGRTGSIAKLCTTTFSDYTYVHLDMKPRERVKKVLMFPLKELEEETQEQPKLGAEASP